MFARIPRWAWWLTGTLVAWVAWAVFVQLPLKRESIRVEPLGEQFARDVQSLNARMAAAPIVLHRLDSVRTHLSTRLGGFTTVDRVDALMAILTQVGRAQGLGGVRVKPDLDHLLRIGSPGHATGADLHIDTISMTVSAEGRFASIGRWMEEIEDRPDFRHWQHARWTSSEDGLANVELRGAFMVVNRVSDALAESADAREEQ